jgi:hypothetical protein
VAEVEVPAAQVHHVEILVALVVEPVVLIKLPPLEVEHLEHLVKEIMVGKP